MVVDAFHRMFTRSREGASISPNEAGFRLKDLKVRLLRVKGEQKRIASEAEKTRTITPSRRIEVKERLRELDEERTVIVKEMRAMQRRLPKR